MIKTPFSIVLMVVLVVACSEDKPKEVGRSAASETPIETGEVVDNTPIISSPSCIPYKDPIRDPKLATLIKTLKRSIAKKDTSLLLSIMDVDVITSYGGGVVGHKEFVETWKTEDYDLWKQLATVMDIGGSYTSDGYYTFPYFTNYKKCNNITQSFLEKDDPYWTYMSIKDTVLLYNAPDSRANVKAKLVYAFVHLPEYGVTPKKGFLKVQTYEKDLVGYVKENEVYRTGDYSLAIKKGQNGQWQIVAFAPYD